jgi:flagellar biosynthesis GTPase FlhF
VCSELRASIRKFFGRVWVPYPYTCFPKTPVEVNSQPELSEQKIDIVLEPCLTIKQTSTPSVPLENKDSEQIDRERLTDAKVKAESPLQKAKEKREAGRAEREAQRQREREEREAQYAKRENERAKEQQMDEKARSAPENFIVDDPDFALPNGLIEKLHDMKCKFDIKTQRFYHTDMAIVVQARQLVREYLN